MQDTDWVIGQELGRGANAVVLAASHPCMPGVVLKKGFLDDLEAEANKMWLAPHPNLVRIFGKVSTTEEDPNDSSLLGYLALEQLGCTLASQLLAGRRWVCLLLLVFSRKLAALVADQPPIWYADALMLMPGQRHAANVCIESKQPSLIKLHLVFAVSQCDLRCTLNLFCCQGWP